MNKKKFKQINCVIFSILLSSCFCHILNLIVLAENISHLYDAQGRYQGRATVNPANPKQTNLYDANGRYVGRVMTGPDGETRLYDQQGRYKGRATGGNPLVPPGQKP